MADTRGNTRRIKTTGDSRKGSKRKVEEITNNQLEGDTAYLCHQQKTPKMRVMNWRCQLKMNTQVEIFGKLSEN